MHSNLFVWCLIVISVFALAFDESPAAACGFSPLAGMFCGAIIAARIWLVGV